MKQIHLIIIVITVLMVACQPDDSNGSLEDSDQPGAVDLKGLEPETVQVSSDGTGDYTTLETAIEAVAPGSTILLGPGQFELSTMLVITKSLTLEGSGASETTVINSNGGSMVVAFDGEHLTIENLSLERTGQFAGDILAVLNGEVNLRNCIISGGASNEDESIRGHGLSVWNETVINISECNFENNMGSGILIVGNAAASIDKVVVKENQFGIAFSGESTGKLTNSTITDNQNFGVSIGEIAEADVSNNTIESNGYAGIMFTADTSEGTKIHDNTLARNHQQGTDILIRSEASPEMRGNTCDGSGESILGGDLNGIVYFKAKVGSIIPSSGSTLQQNSCKVAKCNFPDNDIFKINCINVK